MCTSTVFVQNLKSVKVHQTMELINEREFLRSFSSVFCGFFDVMLILIFDILFMACNLLLFRRHSFGHRRTKNGENVQNYPQIL